MRWTVPALVAALGVVPGRAPDPASARPPDAAPRIVTVVARDHAFQAPDTIASGVVTFRLNDLGPTEHHLVVFRLDDAVTMRAFFDGMRAGVATPAGVTALGGPGNLGGPATSDDAATLVLRPGRYVLGCLKDFADGTTHLVRGMYRPLTVVPGSAAQRAEPAPRADVTVTMRAYGYELSAPLRAGRRVLRLDNAGPQDHHVLVQRLAPGRTKADVERWLAGGRRGERPVSPIFFGTSRQAPDETSYVTIDLEPGAYLFICRVDDAGDGRPHVEHGMRTEVRVR